MSVEIGHFALWIALALAGVLGVVPLVGAQTGRTGCLPSRWCRMPA
jgi:cytochrome c biogenesis factor